MKGRVEQNSSMYRRLRLLNLGYSIGIALIVVGLVFTLWFQGIQIADSGMAPTLRQGDIVLFDKLAKHVSTPCRGDAYAFRQDGGGVSMGRVVGLPGETVLIQEGAVYINGAYLDESAYAIPGSQSLSPFTLGQDEFLLLPDDRTSTSLEAEVMTIPFADLLGRAALRVSPWNRIALFTPY